MVRTRTGNEVVHLCHFSEEAIGKYEEDNPMPRNFQTQAVLQEYDIYE
jgi:hypothetical protein